MHCKVQRDVETANCLGLIQAIHLSYQLQNIVAFMNIVPGRLTDASSSYV